MFKIDFGSEYVTCITVLSSEIVFVADLHFMLVSERLLLSDIGLLTHGCDESTACIFDTLRLIGANSII